MAATGAEYVTLEQLKDLVTNVIQPLKDTLDTLESKMNDLSGVGTWDKSEHGNVSMAEFCENITGAYFAVLPTKIDDSGTGVTKASVGLFGISENGTHLGYDGLGNMFANLMLAAPNGDHTQLFGYLGDNSTSLDKTPSVKSSAALTYAAESGGTSGNVYGVPVDLASDGTATLAVGGSVTIHQNETLFVCSSEYEGFTAGTIAEYSGSSSVELSDSAGQNIAAELVAVYVPTGGTAEVPVGTLSVQGEYGQVFKKTESGTEPIVSIVLSEDQFNPLQMTKPAIGISVKYSDPRIYIGVPIENNEPDLYTAVFMTDNNNRIKRLDADALSTAMVVPYYVSQDGGILIV